METPILDINFFSKFLRWQEKFQKISPNFQHGLQNIISSRALNRKSSQRKIKLTFSSLFEELYA